MTATLENKLISKTEVAKLRVVHALKVIIGLSKKIAMKAMRSLKNGALQFSYLVDGIRCSAFVKAATLQKYENVAIFDSQFMTGVHQYAAAVAQSVGLDATYQDGYNGSVEHCVIETDNKQDLWDGKIYIRLSTMRDGSLKWVAYQSVKMTATYSTSENLKSLLLSLKEKFGI